MAALRALSVIGVVSKELLAELCIIWHIERHFLRDQRHSIRPRNHFRLASGVRNG